MMKNKPKSFKTIRKEKYKKYKLAVRKIPMKKQYFN